jgi:diketogulonate reductase-like aldo/keto reductase
MKRSLTLNSGAEMPIIGLGTYKLGLIEASQAVSYAIDAGYRHFDCAWFYGNEYNVGYAIREKIKQGVVKREDIFVTTKLWNNYHDKDRVIPMLKESVRNIKVGYVDLFLMHWPFGFKVSIN